MQFAYSIHKLDNLDEVRDRWHEFGQAELRRRCRRAILHLLLQSLL